MRNKDDVEMQPKAKHLLVSLGADCRIDNTIKWDAVLNGRTEERNGKRRKLWLNGLLDQMS